jgi:putative transposase
MIPEQSLSHTRGKCKYHLIWIPKYRRKTLFGQLRKELGQVLRELARQKESEIIEGHLLPDHVHILISIPPKHAVAQVGGYIKGKSAIWIARTYGVASETSRANISGLGATMFRPWGGMSNSSEPIFNTRKAKTGVLSN